MSESICRKAFSDTLLQLAAENPAIYAVTSDARGSTTVASFAQKYPQRFVEIGIAEQNEVGVAAGLALMGKIPFVCAPGAFLSARAVEQVKVDVSYSEMNVKLIGVSAGLAYGTSGMSHYAINDFGVMRTFFGMQIFAPADGYQTACLTKLMASENGPAYMRMGRSAVPDVYAGNETFRIGKAYTLKEGNDITIIACGKMVYHAMQAAKELEGLGIHARVLDMFTVKPLDEAAVIKAARETKGIVTLEEHVHFGGLGEAVAAVVCRNHPVAMRMLALPDEHIISGSDNEILNYYGINGDGAVKAAREILG